MIVVGHAKDHGFNSGASTSMIGVCTLIIVHILLRGIHNGTY